MSIRSSISAPGSLDLTSYSQVLHWATEKTRSYSRIQIADLAVYRWNTQIEKVGPFILNSLGLRDALASLVLRFADMPHGLRFVITSSIASNMFPIVTTTVINSQLTFRLLPINGGSLKLETVMRSSESIGRILSSIQSSESRAGRKTRMTSVKGATGNKSTPRMNPELRSMVSTVTNCTQNGCITTPMSAWPVYTRTYTSVNTPGFHAKRRLGQLPVNPYTLSIKELRPGSFSNRHDELFWKTFTSASYPVNRLLSQTDIPAGHLAVDENLVVSRLRGKITSTAQIGEDIFTARQTIGTMGSSFNRFRVFLQLINGGSPKAIRRFLGSAQGANSFVKGVNQMRRGGLAGVGLLSQLWLEYRYGWLPFLSSVEAVTNAFQHFAEKGSDIARVSASRTVETTNKRSVAYASFPNGTIFYRNFYERKSTKCRIILYYKMDNKAVATLSGLGLTSVVGTAWQIVPYSFLVDWFLPIGPALEAFSAFEGMTFVRGSKTYFTKGTVLLNIDNTHNDGNTADRDIGKSFGQSITVSRTALTAFPGPVVPRFKNPISVIHVANAAALIGVLLTGRRR